MRTQASKKSIALVEDERELLETYGDVFRSLGWGPILSSTSGEEVVRELEDRSLRPDVVIMDYRLPGMDGLKAARMIKDRIPETKVVITTADDAVREKAYRAGFFFLQKPFSISTLIGFLERL